MTWKSKPDDSLTDMAILFAYIGDTRADQYIELRMPKRRIPPRQIWIPANETYEVVRTVDRYSKHTDVYVGAAPRARQDGTKEAIERVSMLWVDCDTQESVERLAEFKPEPSLTIASGGDHSVHAWWRLDRNIPPAAAERAMRRLVFTLHADPKCTDVTRIMRPPYTYNHKYDPPRLVTVTHSNGKLYNLATVVGGLPDPPDSEAMAKRRRGPIERKHPEDWLLDIPPEDYVAELTGQDINRKRKTNCPFHDSNSGRSLHVYASPEKGWYCFGCERGGDIYAFASLLWKIDTNTDFKALRRRLERVLHDYK